MREKRFIGRPEEAQLLEVSGQALNRHSFAITVRAKLPNHHGTEARKDGGSVNRTPTVQSDYAALACTLVESLSDCAKRVDISQPIIARLRIGSQW